VNQELRRVALVLPGDKPEPLERPVAVKVRLQLANAGVVKVRLRLANGAVVKVGLRLAGRAAVNLK